MRHSRYTSKYLTICASYIFSLHSDRHKFNTETLILDYLQICIQAVIYYAHKLVGKNTYRKSLCVPQET